MFNQKGLSQIVVLLLATVVLAIVGFAGWRVYEAQQSEEATQQVESSNQDELQNAEDVDALEQELNEADLDAGLDTSELDADMSELQ